MCLLLLCFLYFFLIYLSPTFWCKHPTSFCTGPPEALLRDFTRAIPACPPREQAQVAHSASLYSKDRVSNSVDRNQGIKVFSFSLNNWSVLLFSGSSLLSEDCATSLWTHHLQIFFFFHWDFAWSCNWCYYNFPFKVCLHIHIVSSCKPVCLVYHRIPSAQHSTLSPSGHKTH